MTTSQLTEKEFLDKLTQTVEENLSNEHFGVSELAREIGISRSSLHRKVKSFTKTSAILFISHKRLEHALDMLQHTSFTVSEVAYKVGFNSPSYFIKCFRDYYGYTPGAVGAREEDESDLVSEKSIIVLPFENISPEPDQEYFCDGLTEEVIADLSHIHDLLVISRSSAMTFKGTKSTIKEIVEKVNVRYVLEGSVRKSGNNIRITAQLIDAKTDSHLWAEKYNQQLENIFEIQEHVSRSIADSLKIRLSTDENIKIQTRKIDNATAYQQYLLARHEIWKCTKESVNHAIQLLNNNLDNIGKNEHLLMALATAYFQFVNAGIDPDIKHLDKAMEISDEVLLINPDSSKAHCVKSLVYETNGEIRKSFVSCRRAVELDPNEPDALMMMAFLYTLIGKPEIGRPFARRAIEADPLNPIAYSGEWWVNFSEGNLSGALDTCYKMYNIDKGNLLSVFAYAHSLVWNNRVSKGTEIIDSLIEKHPDHVFAMLGKALKHAVNNQKQEALNSITEHLKKAVEMDHVTSWMLAQVYAIIGEKDKAIDCLERATRDNINYPLFSEYDSLLENVRDEIRFKRLMKKVKNEWENFKI